MKDLLENISLWKIITCEEPKPSPESPEFEIWKAKDSYIRITYLQCIEQEIIPKLTRLDAKQAWDLMENEFKQSGTGSIVYWFHQLFKMAAGAEDIYKHIKQYETAMRYLANAGVPFPEHAQAAMLLTSLPGDSWTSFRLATKVTTTTTFSSMASLIRDEVRS
ncbi:hypothetical protein Clacol_005166 [Clathrus columnatus]|uniref:Uncharacterized protein n=1 Tax=Clathrus columnatus TaxID=1419009 RepID=A0AAV5A8I2_9AGAM|nr:hypothetical protein Clacol_005166 [Clathrus columnatus]